MRLVEPTVAGYVGDLLRAARLYKRVRGDAPLVKVLDRTDLPLPHRVALR